MYDQWLLYLQDQVVDGLGSFLSGCLMQLAKYTIHNHCLFSLFATKVTTLWLKKKEFVFAVYTLANAKLPPKTDSEVTPT